MKGVNITYGSSLAALQHAYENDTSLLLDQSGPPFAYEEMNIRKAWGLLYAKLGIKGQIIGGDALTGCHIQDDIITTVRKGNVVKKTKYGTLHVFSDKNIVGLPAPSKENNNYKVVDYLDATSLSIPHVDILKFEDNLVSEIRFFKNSIRSKTRIYVFSTLTKKQLQNFDYSDTMVKFKCEELLKASGFTGSKNGKKKLLIKLNSTRREAYKKMDFYEDTDKIKFLYAP